MSMRVGEFKDHVTAMLHGGTLKRVRNFEGAMQRAANVMLARIDPIDTMRTLPLSNTVHNNEFNYALPSDFKKLIDLYPQVRRNLWDTANRTLAERFDMRKMLVNKTISIEANNGMKLIRINWKTHQAKVVNAMDTLTQTGTWAAFGSATNVKVNTTDFVSGNGSIQFNLVVTGDGLQNSTMPVVDLTNENGIGDFFLWFKVQNQADLDKLTSVSLVWGNDVSANFWTGVAQTAQVDGTPFQVGWNQVMFPWSTATQTGSVNPATIDSLNPTFTTTGAINNILVDNITCSLGRNFELKEYSKYVLQNTDGLWIPRTTDDDDVIIIDDDAIQIYILETVIACAQQMEGSDAGADVAWCESELWGPPMKRGFSSPKSGLYTKYKAEYPSQSKKAISSYGSPTTRRFLRGNYGYSKFR